MAGAIGHALHFRTWLEGDDLCASWIWPSPPVDGIEVIWRTGTLPSGVSSNVLIAVGAFVPSVASGLTRFGITSLFFLGELLGLACILAGFLLSGSSTARPNPGPSASTGPS